MVEVWGNMHLEGGPTSRTSTITALTSSSSRLLDRAHSAEAMLDTLKGPLCSSTFSPATVTGVALMAAQTPAAAVRSHSLSVQALPLAATTAVATTPSSWSLRIAHGSLHSAPAHLRPAYPQTYVCIRRDRRRLRQHRRVQCISRCSIFASLLHFCLASSLSFTFRSVWW